MPGGRPSMPAGDPRDLRGYRSVLVAAPPRVREPDDLATLRTPADLIELRIDLLVAEAAPEAVAAWVTASPRPVLATVRSSAQGGAFGGAPSEAAALLEAAAHAGAAWIDVEEMVLPHVGELPPGVGVLASVHGSADAAPAWGLDDGRVHLRKIARPVEDAGALRACSAEAEAIAPARGFLVPYGRLGESRPAFVGGLRTGFLYGSAGASSAVVAGQPALDVLLDELRAGEVTPAADLFGLVGRPPARSPSPALHNAVFRAQGRDALYIPLTDLSLDEALALPVRGLSVTHPFKVAAAERADTLAPEAAAAGSVNTLVRTEAGGWLGRNTDALALASFVPRAPDAATAGACVYGSGGLARAAAHVLREGGYAVRINALVEDEGRALAARAGAAWAGAHYARADDDAVVVNATPAGADGEPVPAFAGQSLTGLTVIDAPYARGGVRTGLLRQAVDERAACAVDGLAFLAEQALFQALSFGAPEALLASLPRILSLALDPPRNLVLLGLRGSGKTTVGRRVARLLGRPFADLDAEVGRITGRTPARWIDEAGWDRFREVECDALARIVARRGVVLAGGGGTVEHEGSRALLAEAGTVVYLQLDAPAAAARVTGDGTERPRWPGATDAAHEARLLLARRESWWTGLAHSVVDAGASVGVVAERVVACWCEQGAREHS